jgi:hypothetical protein
LFPRLVGHASVIVFFGGLDWGVHRLLQWLGQEALLWARVVTVFVTVCFVTSLIMIAGGELIVLCGEVIAWVRRSLRRL